MSSLDNVPTFSTRRASLACVDRAFRQFCASHQERTRQQSALIVPFEGWETYLRGAGGQLAWHSITLRDVHVRFEVCNRFRTQACPLQDLLYALPCFQSCYPVSHRTRRVLQIRTRILCRSRSCVCGHCGPSLVEPPYGVIR